MKTKQRPVVLVESIMGASVLPSWRYDPDDDSWDTQELLRDYFDNACTGRHREKVQAEIAKRLLSMRDGTAPQVAFAPGRPKKRGKQVPIIRDECIAMEVFYLMQVEGLTESTAKEAVAQAYIDRYKNMELSVVQRAVKKWRASGWFTPERIALYAEKTSFERLSKPKIHAK